MSPTTHSTTTSVRPACGFCKKNGETEEFYLSHKLRDENNRITCPVLAEYRCSVCNAKGRHTISYCPKRKKNNINQNSSISSGNNSSINSFKLQQPVQTNQPMFPQSSGQLLSGSNTQPNASLSAQMGGLNWMDLETQNNEILRKTLLEIVRELVLGLQVVSSLIAKHV